MGKWTTPECTNSKLYKDMLNQPHLMIAGATGSGKSVVINGLIYTALSSFPFDKGRGNATGAEFILIDPKRVELSQYKNLPHTIKYASEPQEMIDSLSFAMELTEKRYKSMQKVGERKYNGGHVYIFIDEFADLMTTQKRYVKPLIQRLAQIGRAANIHIILATQCPLNTVIPTEIKVNFDARVALRTRNAQDSRNILGRPGCELLPRYGQGYYMTPESTDLWYIPMISDSDIDNRVKWWMDQKKKQGLFKRLVGCLS